MYDTLKRAVPPDLFCPTCQLTPNGKHAYNCPNNPNNSFSAQIIEIPWFREDDTVVTAFTEQARGSGWSNAPVRVILRDSGGALRMECLQPDEQTVGMQSLFDVSCVAHTGMTEAVRRLLDKSTKGARNAETHDGSSGDDATRHATRSGHPAGLGDPPGDVAGDAGAPDAESSCAWCGEPAVAYRCPRCYRLRPRYDPPESGEA